MQSVRWQLVTAVCNAVEGAVVPLGAKRCEVIRLERNPNYWKSDRAHFDQIVLLSILDPAARLNALMTGEVDTIDQVDPASISLLESRGVAKILSISGNAHYVFPMDARAAQAAEVRGEGRGTDRDDAGIGGVA